MWRVSGARLTSLMSVPRTDGTVVYSSRGMVPSGQMRSNGRAELPATGSPRDSAAWLSLVWPPAVQRIIPIDYLPSSVLAKACVTKCPNEASRTCFQTLNQQFL